MSAPSWTTTGSRRPRRTYRSLRTSGGRRSRLHPSSVRHQSEMDLQGTIASVATSSYRQVVFAGYFGKSPRDVRALLDHHGLASPSSHVSRAPDQWRAALEPAPVVGHRYLVIA